MTLSELPTMRVERVEQSASVVTVHGRFDRLNDVRERGCFRFERGRYAWTDLVVLNRKTGTVVVTNSRDPDIARMRVGESYIWFDDYWQAPFIEAVADPATLWHRFTFQAKDAAYFRQGENVGWRALGTPLPEGAVETHVKAGGWDHEHCDLCFAHIDAKHPTGYMSDDRHYMCSGCYDKFGATHDVAFAVFPTAAMRLVWPSREYLPGYVAALQRGWSPDNLRGVAAAQDELLRIANDPNAFLGSLVDREAAGDPILLPDGTKARRLPGYRRWLWDGEFCGSIGFRWQPGTEALPPHCLGHIGYGVVPWKQRRGYATSALRETLKDAKAEGLRFVEITTDPDNVASRRVIEANGGVMIEEFVTIPALGGDRKVRYRVQFDD